jgi:N-hydroxyarylamine O-acetyltransferase
VSGVVQATPHGPVRLVEERGWWTLEAGDRRLYTFDLVEHHPVDYELANWWTSAHPSSHFRTTLIAARIAPDRRHTLRNLDYAEHFPDGRTERRPVTDLEELRTLLRDTFRIRIPADPRVDAALARIVEPAVDVRGTPAPTRWPRVSRVPGGSCPRGTGTSSSGSRGRCRTAPRTRT